MIGVQYKDPDGKRVFCYNSEIANLKLKVFERRGGSWGKVDELVSEHTTAFEYAQRLPVSRIPIHLVAGKLPGDK